MADPTVYDVAREAHVSIATVSRVLNSPDQVNEATRDRVLAAIDALQFVPKAEAADRARQSNRLIGVLAPFFTSSSFVQRLRGVAAAVADTPYELAVYNVDSSAHRDGYLASLTLNRRIDGLIVMALPFDAAAGRRLHTHNLPTVLVEFAHQGFSSLEIDNEAGGRMAAEYLMQKGHRRCAFVGDASLPDYAIHTSDWRLAGYRTALQEAGLPLPDMYVSVAPHGVTPRGIESARQQGIQLLDLPDPPSAIFAASDIQAMGVLKAARERGIAVPEQLAVIGFDDIDIADYVGLTTIRQQLDESGRVAVEMLLSRLADPARPVQRISLPLTLIVRQTA